MAEIVNLNFKADANFGPLIAEVNRAMAALSKFRNAKLAEPLGLNRKDFEKAVVDFRDLVTATGMFSSSMVDVTSSTTKFGKALSGQNLKLKEYAKAYIDFRRTAGGQIRALAEEQVRISQSVVKSMGRDAAGVQRALVFTPTGIDALAHSAKIGAQQTQILNKVLRDGSTSLINWGKNTQWAGRQLTVGLTLPIMLFGKTTADAFKRADESLVRLLKVYGGISGVSSTELAKVRKDVTELSKTLASTYGASFEETLGLAADIAATGAEGNDLLAATAETTRLAILGDVDRQESMKATLALQTAFKLNTQQLTESINLLNAVENQTSTTLQDLVEAIPKAGPVIKGLGGDVGTLALFLTAMREGGINAAEGANALKSGLASLINPTKQAVEKLSGFGININEIVNSNAGDLVGLIFDLQAALDKLDPLQKQQAIEQLFGKYQFARLGALLNNIGREGSQSLAVLDIMKASTEDLAATADRELTALTESASGRYKRALETFKAALAEFGEPFLDIFSGILKAGTKVLELFRGMPGPVKALLTGIAGITAIIGPLIMLTGIMGNFIGYIIKGIAAFRQFRSGAQAFELITTSTVAADQVADAYTKTTYNQAQAIDVLRASLEKLEMAYRDIANAAAGGPPPPPPVGGMGGVPYVPMGPVGPTIPGGTPSSTGGAIATSAAVSSYLEEIAPLREAGAVKRQELEKILSNMTPEEADAYLMERVKQSQRSVETMGIGRNRSSSQVLPYTHAGLFAMGLASEGGDIVGQYREETGAGRYSIFGATGGHVDPAEKERVRRAHFDAAIAEGMSPADAKSAAERRIAAGNIPEPAGYGMSAGSMSGQERLLTREGAMAVVIGEELMKEEYAKAPAKGKLTPFKKIGEKFKAAKKTVPVASDLPIASKEELLRLTQEKRLASAPAVVPVPQQPISTAPIPDQELTATRTKSGQIQVRGAGGKLVPQSSAAAQAAIIRLKEKELGLTDDIDKSTKSITTNTGRSQKNMAQFAARTGMAVGTAGMLSSMYLAMQGSTNELAMKTATWLTMLGFAAPAVSTLSNGLKNVGANLSRSTGAVGLLGRGLAFLGTGPGMIAIATITALTLGIKKLIAIHEETLRKARADIYVTEEALKAFGGAALTAKDDFATYIKTVEALRQRLITASQAKGIPGLPTPEEIEKVKEQVKNLYKDQINRVKDISNKQEAIDFGRNLKSTLVVQGVEEKTASAIIASIFEEAGKSTMSIPVLLDIAGIKTGEQGIEQLKDAAQKTFDEISDKLDGGSIKQKVAERFSEQLDLLSASALAQVKDFEDLKNVINVLPEEMRNLTFEQLNASAAGRTLLKGMQDTNPELYQAFRHAESLAAALQLTAASSLGLATTLTGVTGQLAIAGQNAMKMVSSQEYAKSGIQEYYGRLISGEQNTIARLKKRMKAELEANENRKKAIEDQIDLEKEKIDQIKKEADARKDLLREQQKEKKFEQDLAQLRFKQDIAMRVGNFAEAAMLGLDIEEMMQERSVDLAEKAIEDKEKREVELHENKIKLLEEEKKKIKELTDEQKASIEARYNKLIEKHNKAIEIYRQDAAKSAQTFTELFEKAASGNVMAYEELRDLLKSTGGDLGLLGNTFNEFLRKTVNSFSQAFGDSLAALLGPDYRVKDGVIQKGRPGPKGRGIRYDDVTTIADLFGIKTGPQGMGPLGISTADKNVLDNVRPKSIPTKYGTFTLSESAPGSQVYIARYKKGDLTIPIPINNPTAKQIEDYLDRVEPGRKVQALYNGGPVSGPGTSTSDSIPAYLSNGEYVVRASAVDHYGVDTFDAMNAKKLKGGGPVGSNKNVPTRLLEAVGSILDVQNPLLQKLFGSDMINSYSNILSGKGGKGDYASLGASVLPVGPGAKLFHGTHKLLKAGDIISPSGRTLYTASTGKHIYAGTDADTAAFWGKKAAEKVGQKVRNRFRSYVYEIEPIGKTIVDAMTPDAMMIEGGARIVRMVKKARAKASMGFADGGYIGKLHTWNGPVPGPYGKEVAATLKAGTEGVYQTQYINSLQKDSAMAGDSVYNINVNVTSPGASADQIATAIEAKMRLNEQRVGYSRSVNY